MEKINRKKLASDESPMTPNKIKHRNNSGITLTTYAFANFRFVITKCVAGYDGYAARVAPATSVMDKCLRFTFVVRRNIYLLRKKLLKYYLPFAVGAFDLFVVPPVAAVSQLYHCRCAMRSHVRAHCDLIDADQLSLRNERERKNKRKLSLWFAQPYELDSFRLEWCLSASRYRTSSWMNWTEREREKTNSNLFDKHTKDGAKYLHIEFEKSSTIAAATCFEPYDLWWSPSTHTHTST